MKTMMRKMINFTNYLKNNFKAYDGGNGKRIAVDY